MSQIQSGTDDQLTRRVSIQTPASELGVVSPFFYTYIQLGHLPAISPIKGVEDILARANLVLRFRRLSMCAEMTLSPGGPEGHD